MELKKGNRGRLRGEENQAVVGFAGARTGIF